ncbi:hypothetical protein FZQ06_15040 [Escherichia coli]|nr:hypothetical protein [Escherichia coli]
MELYKTTVIIVSQIAIFIIVIAKYETNSTKKMPPLSSWWHRSVCQVLTGFLWTLKTIFMVSHYSSRQVLFSSALASGSIGNLIRDQLCGWFAEQA